VLLTLNGHSGGGSPVVFSPDGLLIVTISADQAKVFEAASGRPLLTLKGHSARIMSVGFSPDGQQIITGSWDGTAKVWETASGRPLLTLNGHSGGVASVAFSADGQRIVTGSDDNTAKVWDAASGRELLPLKGYNGGIWAVAFSPDGQRIVTGSRDHMAKVWKVASAVQVAAWQKEDKAAAERLAVLWSERAEATKRDQLRGAEAAGNIRHVTFTKWATAPPTDLQSYAGISFGGVVGGDVGSGRLGGEVLSDDQSVGGFWLGHARYEFYGEEHSFIADVYVTQNNTTEPATAVITGVITQGWLKGAQVSGKYTQILVSPLPTPGNVNGTLSWQGTLDLQGGSEQ
jgi:WD40 repeat protein